MKRTQVVYGQEAIDLETQLVHDWPVTRLAGVGIPRPIAENRDDMRRIIIKVITRGAPSEVPATGSFAGYR